VGGATREYDKIVATARERRQGYAPYRQVFGLLFAAGSDEYKPAVLKVFKWSAFINFERAGQKWNKVIVPEGQVLVRRYGSLGKTDKGVTVPNFEVFGQGHSTPIEAIGLDKPRFYDLTPELEALWETSLPWRKCERWNAVGKVEDEATTGVQAEFEAKCAELGFDAEMTAGYLSDYGGSYLDALSAITGDAINAALEAGEEEEPFASF